MAVNGGYRVAMNPWPLIVSALRRHHGTALAFVLLVAAGVTLAVAITSQERALRSGSARAAERFDIVVAPPGSRTDALLSAVFLRPGSSRLLSAQITAALLADTRAVFASPLAFGDSHRGAPVIGAIAALTARLSPTLAEGRHFAARGEAVVGAASTLRLGDTFAPAHGIHHAGKHHSGEADNDLHEASIRVVGRMSPTGSPWDRAIVVPIETVWALHELPDGQPEGATRIGPPFDAGRVPGIPAAVLHPRSVADAYRLRAAYTGTESMAFFPAEVLVQLYATLGDIRQLMSLIAIATQLLVLAAIVASVLLILKLLAPRFVTLRMLGAPRRYVFAVAWGYTATLVTLGVGLGLVGGYALSFGLARWLEASSGVALRPSLGAAEWAMAAIMLALGWLLALLPAWRVQRLDLALAMKGV